jgi:hypothetical protein
MNLCGTCKHWGTEEDAKEKYRKCQKVVHDSPDEDEHMSAPQAYTIDAEWFSSRLMCRKDFGCVLHKVKS